MYFGKVQYEMLSLQKNESSESIMAKQDMAKYKGKRKYRIKHGDVKRGTEYTCWQWAQHVYSND